tara:strand:- start:324 stop:731 length:408 start_codon:yes stop_codon:yes gene_type:complete
MSFKVTPITKRKVKYKTITWNQKTDGNMVSTSTFRYKNVLHPAITSPDNVAVSVTLEIIEPVTSVGAAPLCLFQGDSAYSSLISFVPTSYSAGVYNLSFVNTIRRFGGELQVILFPGELDAGHFALTVGYLEKQQ